MISSKYCLLRFYFDFNSQGLLSLLEPSQRGPSVSLVSIYMVLSYNWTSNVSVNHAELLGSAGFRTN